MKEEIKPTGESRQIERHEQGHTRWIVNAHGYDSPYLVKAFIETRNGKPICGLFEGDGVNARLIAAAPALYQAAEAAMRYIQTDPVLDDDGIAVYSALRDAIADAQGVSSRH